MCLIQDRLNAYNAHHTDNSKKVIALNTQNGESHSQQHPAISSPPRIVERFLGILNRHRPDLDRFIDLYKDIHQHPELSTLESRTAKVVAECLEDIGLEVHRSIGGTEVVGVLRNGQGKTFLLRAELDALPMEEKTGLPYASIARMKDIFGKDQPVMHSCGHDVHIACELVNVQLLKSAVKEWSGTIVAVFQPAEEHLTGAKAMVSDSLYSIFPQPDIMLAQHVGMSKAGLVAVKTGPVLAASDYIYVDLYSDGPGANPSECPEQLGTVSTFGAM